MGQIIALRSPRPRVLAPASGRGAEILFFTGVRYERMGEAPVGLASSGPSRAIARAAERERIESGSAVCAP